MFYNTKYAELCSQTSSQYSQCVSDGTLPVDTFSFTFPGVGRHCVFMAGYGGFFLLLLIALEFGIVRLLNSMTHARPVGRGRPSVFLFFMPSLGYSRNIVFDAAPVLSCLFCVLFDNLL